MTHVYPFKDEGSDHIRSKVFDKRSATEAPSTAGGSTPTGTGFTHITAGVPDAAAATIDGQSAVSGGDVKVIAPGTNAATSKATPVDNDELPLVDSAASNVLKKLLWSNVKATLKTYFDTLYAPTASAGWTTIIKSSDEARTSNNTLTDDSTLVASLAASTTYAFEFEIWLNTANATMDYKFQFAYTGTIASEYDRNTSTNAGTPTVDAISGASASINAGAGVVTAGTSGLARVTLKGNVTTGTAGTLSFKWAQNTSDAAAITVRRGSYLRYKAA